MTKYLNVGDAIFITLAAYVVVWGINYFLRISDMGELQA